MSIEIEQWHVVGFFSQKEFLVKLTRLVGFVVQCRSFYNYVGCSTISFSSKLATKRPSEWSSSMAFECGSEWSVRIQANLFQLMKSSLLQSNISVWKVTAYNTITMWISGPYFFTASTLLVQAFIPMAHGSNPGFHVRPNLSPQGQAQDHIPSSSLWRYTVTVPPPPVMPGYSVFRPMLTPPPTDLQPPSTSSDDPVDWSNGGRSCRKSLKLEPQYYGVHKIPIVENRTISL